MLGNLIVLLGLAVLLGATSPALLSHLHSNFLLLRIGVGLMLLVGLGGMAVFLLDGSVIVAFVLGSFSAGLAYAGALVLLRNMTAQADLTKRQRRRQKKRLGSPGLVGAKWFSALCGVAGFILSLATHRP